MWLVSETRECAHWRAPGKINLYLDVLRRRGDGYHDIETIFQSVSWWDDVVVDVSGETERIALACSEPELESEDNLAYRAACLLRERSGTKQGARIWIRKRIPVGGGMAGGSADAAAVLVALNRLWSLNYAIETLRELALKLGSDVPFCLTGGTAAAGGRGERMVFLPPVTGLCHAVLVFPGIISRTADVYRHPSLCPSGEPPSGETWTSRFAAVLERLRAGRLGEVVFNRLETPVFSLYPLLCEIRDFLSAAGCVAAVSGSGSTIFGLCATAEEALAVRDRIRRERGWTAEAVTMWHPEQNCGAAFNPSEKR